MFELIIKIQLYIKTISLNRNIKWNFDYSLRNFFIYKYNLIDTSKKLIYKMEVRFGFLCALVGVVPHYLVVVVVVYFILHA